MTILPNTQDLGDATPVKSGFRLDVHDRLVIYDKPHRVLGMSGDKAELIPESGVGMTEVFPMSTLSRLSATGHIKHEVGYYLPDDLKPAPAVAAFDFQPSNLVGKARVRFDAKLAQIKAIEDMEAEGILRPNKEGIEAARSDIEKRAEEYFKAQAVTSMDVV